MSHLLSSALIIHGVTFINLNTLINQICKESNQLKSWCLKEQGGKKNSIIDEALITTHLMMGSDGQMSQLWQIGFIMGNPQVSIFNTIPVTREPIPDVVMGKHCTVPTQV